MSPENEMFLTLNDDSIGELKIKGMGTAKLFRSDSNQF